MNDGCEVRLRLDAGSRRCIVNHCCCLRVRTQHEQLRYPYPTGYHLSNLTKASKLLASDYGARPILEFAPTASGDSGRTCPAPTA